MMRRATRAWSPPLNRGVYLDHSFGPRRARRFSWQRMAETLVYWIVLLFVAVVAVASLVGFAVLLFGLVLLIAALLRGIGVGG
jgi:hypothetical protein